MQALETCWPRVCAAVVIVRSDLNVPLDGSHVTDDGRIRASLPTIPSLADAGARVVVCSHLGRPKGAFEAKYSLAPVAERMSALLGWPVPLADYEPDAGVAGPGRGRARRRAG